MLLKLRIFFFFCLLIAFCFTSGFIDDVIEPRCTRRLICQDLDKLANKQQKNPSKKHGNIPL